MADSVIGDPMLDEEWLAAPTKRSRLRGALAVILAAAVCFLGGAMVQKHLGTSTADAAAGFGGGQLPEELPEGLAEGGFPGGAGGVPGTTDGAEGPDETEAVIGEVVEIRGDVWIVEDLSGERHEVTFGDNTDVVRETDLDPARVKVGDPVDVVGTPANGRLHATEVTLR